MHPQSLFKKQTKENPQAEQTTIANGSTYDDLPFTLNLDPNLFNIKKGNDLQRFKLLSEGVAEIGYIASLDLAHLKGDWKLVPNIAKSSYAGTPRILLFFNRSLSSINKIAVPAHNRTAIALTKLVFSEYYEIEVTIEEEKSTGINNLSEYDGVVLVEEDALSQKMKNSSFLDLGEAWYELTSLPFTYGVWVANTLTVKKQQLQDLAKGFSNKPEELEQVAAEKAPAGWSGQQALEYLTTDINYRFGEQEQKGLKEFLQLAIYYGLTEQVPEIDFIED